MPAVMRRVLAVVIVMASVCGMARGASTVPVAAPAAPAGVLRFDIAAQPLAEALTAFHRLTGASLLYDASTASGLSAAAVQGEMTPAAALQRLLEGTGVVARPTSATGFLLAREPLEAAAPLPAPAAAPADAVQAVPDPALLRYRGRLQARILSALCADPRTVPGTYRLAMNLWTGADGRIARLRIHPTGEAARDARIEALLSGLDLGDAAPAPGTSPVALLVLPRPPSQTGDCTAEAP